jgi:hypothetical protein
MVTNAGNICDSDSTPQFNTGHAKFMLKPVARSATGYLAICSSLNYSVCTLQSFTEAGGLKKKAE